MSRRICIQNGETFSLDFPQELYPGWEVGDMLSDQIVSSTGTTYCLGGYARVLSVLRNNKGNYLVKVTNFESALDLVIPNVVREATG